MKTQRWLAAAALTLAAALLWKAAPAVAHHHVGHLAGAQQREHALDAGVGRAQRRLDPQRELGVRRLLRQRLELAGGQRNARERRAQLAQQRGEELRALARHGPPACESPSCARKSRSSISR